jgi:hypothetical protein
MHKMERPTIKLKTKECRSTTLADISLNLLKRTEPPVTITIQLGLFLLQCQL